MAATLPRAGLTPEKNRERAPTTRCGRHGADHTVLPARARCLGNPLRPHAGAATENGRAPDHRESGGRGRNRTGVHGFAVRCIATLPPGLRRMSGAAHPVTFRRRAAAGSTVLSPTRAAAAGNRAKRAPGSTSGAGCEENRDAKRPGRRDRAGAPARAKVRETSGTGPRSGPAGATAPARRKARKPSERSERPAPEGKE